MTARQEILDAIDALGKEVFSLQEVLAELRAKGTRYAERTIRTHVTSRMCANAPGHHATVYDDLERVDRGLYRLRR